MCGILAYYSNNDIQLEEFKDLMIITNNGVEVEANNENPMPKNIISRAEYKKLSKQGYKMKDFIYGRILGKTG